jgi:hypothetical protein
MSKGLDGNSAQERNFLGAVDSKTAVGCVTRASTELVGHLVAGSAEAVGDFLAHDCQDGDYDQRNQRNQQAILHQGLSIFFCEKTFDHFTSP